MVNLGEKLERQEATGAPARNGDTDSSYLGDHILLLILLAV